MSRLIVLFLFISISAQSQLAPLTVEKIMRDPKWIGVAPTEPYWIGKNLYFKWNPDHSTGDSLYTISTTDLIPKKVNVEVRKTLPGSQGIFNRARTKRLYEKSGDLFLSDLLTGKLIQITNTIARENDANFSGDESKVFFGSGSNLFSWEIATGTTRQYTEFRQGEKTEENKSSDQEKWLEKDQLSRFEVLKSRSEKKKEAERNIKAGRQKAPKEIYLGDLEVDGVQMSGDQNYVIYRLSKRAKPKSTDVPAFITESGFTEDLIGRPKVGAARDASRLFVYDIRKDTVFEFLTSEIPGIYDDPDYKKDYVKQKQDSSKNNKEKKPRQVHISTLVFSPDGKTQVSVITSTDKKDRWIMQVDPATHSIKVLHRLRDEAWIGWLPSFNNIGWVDNKTIWFESEESGYAHLYTLDVIAGTKKTLTSGKYEVQSVVLSADKKFFYITTNEVHPGETQLYKLPVTGGKAERLTSMTGAHESVLSDDEKWIASRHSYSNKPWEIYLQENKTGAKPKQITFSLSDEFKSYPWRDPELVTIKARDGADIYARFYKPAKPNGAAVIFVHGAGYLQNAHRWWSSYFREYMFHNLLTDQGYTVLDMDYRASSGYGRDWRTGIYRHMGGKDLTDNLDGAKWLIEKNNIDPKKLGIYGGSYGGFITLMAMFTQPDVFAAGAALRPVTDWAHYNDPYTSSILNEPYNDSIAYARSSPIHFASGLKGSLLICHGMVDVNVQFQDAVMLTQRLIELGKDNWELAVYPMEDHAFVEPSSWTDEYKRILKLFEENLR